MDAQSGAAMEGKGCNPFSGKEDLAPGWSEKPREEIKGRGFSCAIWAQKAGDFPGLEAHGKAIHGADVPESLYQIPSLKNGGQL